jgi:hypothetical protein
MEEPIVWSKYRRSHCWVLIVDSDDVNACVTSWKRTFVYEKRVNVHRSPPSTSSIWLWSVSCSSSEDTSVVESLRSWNSMWQGDHCVDSRVLSSTVTIRRRSFPERYGDACHCSWYILLLFVLPLHMNQLNHCLKTRQTRIESVSHTTNISKKMSEWLQSIGHRSKLT